MEYQVLELVEPYLDKNDSIFHALVSKEWLQVVKMRDESFITPYGVIISHTLLGYSINFLNLVCIDKIEKIKGNIIKNGNLENMKWLKENGCPQ